MTEQQVEHKRYCECCGEPKIIFEFTEVDTGSGFVCNACAIKALVNSRVASALSGEHKGETD